MIKSAFTCTGPYAVLIMLGLKRVENRCVMPYPSNGRCAISCSKSFNQEEFGKFVYWASKNLLHDDFDALPSWSDIKSWPGKIIGACDYRADSTKPDNLWNEGYSYWWHLSNVVSFDNLIPCRGNIGMWSLDDRLAKLVTKEDSLSQIVGTRILSPSDAAAAFISMMPITGCNEGMFVLPLDDTKAVVSRPILVSIGDIASVEVQLCNIFSEAMKVDANSIIVAHNHPSGNVNASIQDRLFTEELFEVGRRLGIKVLDHLIISDQKWASLKKGYKEQGNV